jgi:hypothetical protein
LPRKGHVHQQNWARHGVAMSAGRSGPVDERPVGTHSPILEGLPSPTPTENQEG